MASSEYLRRRVGGPSSVSEVAEMGLKTFSVLARHIKPDPAKPATIQVLKAPLAHVKKFLAALQPLELYSDWVPGKGEPLVELNIDKDQVYANSKKNDDSTAQKAVESGGSSWVSSSGRSHHWGVKLPDRPVLTRIVIDIKPTYWPEKLEVQVDEGSGSKDDFKTKEEFTFEKDPKSQLVITFNPAIAAKGVKLMFTGTAAGNSNNCVSLIRVQLFSVKDKETYLTSLEALRQLREWLVSVLAFEDSSARESALTALIDLATASGSFNTLLIAVTALLRESTHALTGHAVEAGKRLLEALEAQVRQEREANTKAEYTIAATSSSGGGAMPAYGEIEGVAFDKSSSSSEGEVSFSNNDTTVRSVTSSNTHAVLNVGPFTTGKASWSFKLDDDTDSQCSCFGAAIKPVTNSSYEYSSCLYMHRAFNGNSYSLGSCDRYGSDSDKVRKGETIRLDLDFDSGDGEIRATINDRDIGVLFKNLRGKEIWPAVAFYSSNRQISIVSVEGPADVARSCGLKIFGSASAPGGGSESSVLGNSRAVFLNELTPEEVVTGKGTLGLGGKLGFVIDESPAAAVAIGKNDVSHALSIHPPARVVSDDGEVKAVDVDGKHLESDDKEVVLKATAELTATRFKDAASITYWLGGKYEKVEGGVCLNDTATAELRKASDASPLYFELYSGQNLLWRSQPFHLSGSEIERFSVQVRGVQALRLVTRAMNGNAGAHAVWVNPVLTTAAEWGFYGWRNSAEALRDAITGVARGSDIPVPSTADLALGSYGDLAVNAVKYVGLLSLEYFRSMRGSAPYSADVADIDLEGPYVLEPAEETMASLQQLLSSVLVPGSSVAGADDDVAVAAALIRALTANLRRVTYSRISPAIAGLAVAEKSKKDKKKAEAKDTESFSPVAVVSALSNQVKSLATWGGRASGKAFEPSAAANAARNPVLQHAIWDFLDLTRSFFTSDKAERLALVTGAAGSTGTVELQLQWPCEKVDNDGVLLQLESVILQLRLACQQAGRRCKILGRWPAKVFLIVAVDDISNFLESELPEMFSNVDLPDWWLSNHTADVLPLQLQPSADWDRKARLPIETGVGAVRVYPSFVCAFDDVVSGLQSFLPPDEA